MAAILNIYDILKLWTFMPKLKMCIRQTMWRKNMKSKKVLISIKEDLLNLVDKIADEESRSRSELIRESLRLYMNNRPVVSNTTVDQTETNTDPFSTVFLR